MKDSDEISKCIDDLESAINGLEEVMKADESEFVFNIHKEQKLVLIERLNTLKWVIQD
jgi:hypothetical protein